MSRTCTSPCAISALSCSFERFSMRCFAASTIWPTVFFGTNMADSFLRRTPRPGPAILLPVAPLSHGRASGSERPARRRRPLGPPAPGAPSPGSSRLVAEDGLDLEELLEPVLAPLPSVPRLLVTPERSGQVTGSPVDADLT